MTIRLPVWAEARPALVLFVAGAASATGFAPLGLWPVTILTLAMLLGLLSAARTGVKAALLGYAYGLGQFVVGLNWIAHAFTYQDTMPHWLGYIAVVLLSFYLAVYPAAATLLTWRLAKGRGAMAITLVMAGAWAITEYLRASLFTGFAWNPLGVIWLGTGVDQSAILIGTYGLGIVAMLAGGAVWMLIRGQRGTGAVLAALLVGIALFGWLQVNPLPLTPPGRPPVTIRVIQPNIGQDEAYSPGVEWRSFQKQARLTGAPTDRPRLVFWPEGAVYALLDMEPEWRARLAMLMGPGDLLMTGGDKYYFRRTSAAVYGQGDLLGANNSLWVVTPDARIAGRYDKAHLVPYGEYLPMRPILSAIGLSRLVQGDVDFWSGPGPRTLTLPAGPGRPALRMGGQICYEIIFSGQVIDRAHRPDFLFNPSNDAWFGRWGPPQHLAQARLRALEEGVPIIRSTPTGISALVDAHGRLLKSLPLGFAGHFDAQLPPATAPTPFALMGNIAPMALAIALIISGVALGRAKR